MSIYCVKIQEGVSMEKVCSVGGGLRWVLLGFISEEKEFGLNLLWDTEPVKDLYMLWQGFQINVLDCGQSCKLMSWT